MRLGRLAANGASFPRPTNKSSSAAFRGWPRGSLPGVHPHGQSRGGRLLAQTAILRRAAVPPGFLLLFAGVVAGPEQGFAAGEPVAEGVTTVAGARAADHALLGGPFQPARQGRAVRRVCL